MKSRPKVKVVRFFCFFVLFKILMVDAIVVRSTLWARRFKTRQVAYLALNLSWRYLIQLS
jgi:hypothetical protein